MNLTIRQNLTNSALSQYTDFFFDRGIVRLGEKTFALKCDALCRIGGDTDNGTDIDATIQTGVTDFADGEKRARSFHFKGQFDSIKAVSMKYVMDGFTPSTSGVSGDFSRIGSNGSGAIKFNGRRELHGEHISIAVENVDGASFFITGVKAFLVNGSRR